MILLNFFIFHLAIRNGYIWRVRQRTGLHFDMVKRTRERNMLEKHAAHAAQTAKCLPQGNRQIPAIYDAAGRQFFQARNLPACVMGLRGTQLSRWEKHKYYFTYTTASARRSLLFPNYINSNITFALHVRVWWNNENATPSRYRSIKDLQISSTSSGNAGSRMGYAWDLRSRTHLHSALLLVRRLIER